MRIGENSPLSQPAAAPKAAAPAKAAEGPAPKIAGDSFSASANDVNVVTFNVAGGASKFKLEEKLIDNPVFQKVIKGDADAPIVACQEMTPALAKKLTEAAKKSGNFEVIYPGKTWLPKWIPISTLMQGNLLLVPKRYKVEETESKTFAGRAGRFFTALKDFAFHHGPAKNLLLSLQNRGYVSAELKDTKTGKRFGVLGTHVAYEASQRTATTPELVGAIKKLQAKGPTIVMGDMNVPTLEADPNQSQSVKDFWNAMPDNLKDMGPTGKDRGTFWGNDKDIDVVQANGFERVSSEVLKGDKMTLPGRPDAKQVSDHYAEADTIRFE